MLSSLDLISFNSYSVLTLAILWLCKEIPHDCGVSLFVANEVSKVAAGSGYNLTGAAVAAAQTATAPSPMAQLSHRLQTSIATVPSISSASLPPKSVQVCNVCISCLGG